MVYYTVIFANHLHGENYRTWKMGHFSVYFRIRSYVYNIYRYISLICVYVVSPNLSSKLHIRNAKMHDFLLLIFCDLSGRAF